MPSTLIRHGAFRQSLRHASLFGQSPAMSVSAAQIACKALHVRGMEAVIILSLDDREALAAAILDACKLGDIR